MKKWIAMTLVLLAALAIGGFAYAQQIICVDGMCYMTQGGYQTYQPQGTGYVTYDGYYAAQPAYWSAYGDAGYGSAGSYANPAPQSYGSNGGGYTSYRTYGTGSSGSYAAPQRYGSAGGYAAPPQRSAGSTGGYAAPRRVRR